MLHRVTSHPFCPKMKTQHKWIWQMQNFDHNGLHIEARRRSVMPSRGRVLVVITLRNTDSHGICISQDSFFLGPRNKHFHLLLSLLPSSWSTWPAQKNETTDQKLSRKGHWTCNCGYYRNMHSVSGVNCQDRKHQNPDSVFTEICALISMILGYPI